MAINTSVYSVTGQTAQAYKTPSIKIDIPKQTRIGAYQQMRREDEAKKFRQSVDDFVLTKINDLPEDYTAEKLPPAVQSAIQPIILSARQQYANSARLLAGMKGQVGTPDYLKVMDGMNRSKKVIENLNSNLVDLQKLTNEYVENREMMSKGMNAEKVAALDEIFVNKNYTMQFMPDGSPLYQTQYGALKQEDISKYFLKDSTFSLDILKQAQSMYSKGTTGLDLSKNQSAFQLLKAQFSNALDKGGPETIKSLLADDLFDGFKLIDIPDEIANDPSKKEEVKDMLLDSIMGHISTVNADGLKQYKAKQVASTGGTKGSGSGRGNSVRGYKMGQGLQDDLASFDPQRAEAREDINKVVGRMAGMLGETRIPEGERQVLFAQKVPEYRQEIVNLIKDRMSPSDRGKLMTREEMFELFRSDEDVMAREFNPDQLREAFINTYGNAGFYYDNNPFDIDITDAYSISNALFDLADISQDAKNTYKSELALEQRSSRLAQQRRAQNPSGAARFNPSN
tara:strand:+ start:888 stop:2423 length:1536 start_codon:yes stop_codon:yes gene_type:complete